MSNCVDCEKPLAWQESWTSLENGDEVCRPCLEKRLDPARIVEAPLLRVRWKWKAWLMRPRYSLMFVGAMAFWGFIVGNGFEPLIVYWISWLMLGVVLLASLVLAWKAWRVFGW